MIEQVISNKAGWTRVAFGDVVRLSNERAKDPEAEGYDRVVGLEHIDPGDLRIRRWADIVDGTTFTSVFKPGQVLFGKRRAYQRKVAVADFTGVCSGDIYVLEASSDALMPELLPFICQTDAFFDHADGTSAGSLSPRTNWKSLASFEFMLPPIQEQARLVEALRGTLQLADTLLSARNRALTARSSYLNELFGYSGTGARQYGAITAPDTWKPRRLPDLAVPEKNSITAGPFGTIFKAKDFRESGIPIIQLRHITEAGTNLDELTFMDVQVYERVHTPYTVHPGDLLLTKMGDPPGLAAIYPEDAPIAMVTPDVIKVTLNEDVVLPDFAVALFNNVRSRTNMLRLCKGGTRTRVSLDELYSLNWPIPSLDEQTAISAVLSQFEDSIVAIDKRLLEVGKLKECLASSFDEGAAQ